MGWSVNRPTGLTFHAPQKSTKGYTLVTPFGGDSAYLIDMQGKIVHRWRIAAFNPQYARLLESGNLLVSGRSRDITAPSESADALRKNPPTFERRVQMIGGHYDVLCEFDWDGNTVWSHSRNTMHHDFIRLDNGNVLVPEFVEVPPDVHGAVRGGARRPRTKRPPLISDDIVEIDPSGNDVRRIELWSMLDPIKDPIGPLEGLWEWTHTNGIDINQAGEIVFSCRNNSRIGIIDALGKSLKWKYAKTTLQHNTSWVAKGRNVQVFDNGRTGSRVLEIDPETDELVWSFSGHPPQQFFSGHISGADRLPNDSVLVCEGASGRLFEVTRGGEVVWEWINPFVNLDKRGNPTVGLYRAHRYLPDHPGLTGRDLSGRQHRELNELNGLI